MILAPSKTPQPAPEGRGERQERTDSPAEGGRLHPQGRNSVEESGTARLAACRGRTTGKRRSPPPVRVPAAQRRRAQRGDHPVSATALPGATRARPRTALLQPGGPRGQRARASTCASRRPCLPPGQVCHACTNNPRALVSPKACASSRTAPAFRCRHLPTADPPDRLRVRDQNPKGRDGIPTRRRTSGVRARSRRDDLNYPTFWSCSANAASSQKRAAGPAFASLRSSRRSSSHNQCVESDDIRGTPLNPDQAGPAPACAGRGTGSAHQRSRTDPVTVRDAPK